MGHLKNQKIMKRFVFSLMMSSKSIYMQRYTYTSERLHFVDCWFGLAFSLFKNLNCFGTNGFPFYFLMYRVREVTKMQHLSYNFPGLDKWPAVGWENFPAFYTFLHALRKEEKLAWILYMNIYHENQMRTENWKYATVRRTEWIV